MKSAKVAFFGLLAFAAVGMSGAQAETIYDLEHARANARAGGPVTEFDAELLERWGPSSGTYRDRRYSRGHVYRQHYDGYPRRHRLRGRY